MAEIIDRQMLLNFVLNEVSEKNSKIIIKEIDNNKNTRQKYIHIKRKIDIERYIENDMPIDEKKDFEELLEKDKKLKAYHDLSKDVDEFISIMANFA